MDLGLPLAGSVRQMAPPICWMLEGVDVLDSGNQAKGGTNHAEVRD
jgi:hypothetical protein